jgi:hypothetical protein
MGQSQAQIELQGFAIYPCILVICDSVTRIYFK